MAQIQQQQQQQQQQISMHFGPIDPAQFDSSKLFEQIQPADNVPNVDVQPNISEVAVSNAAMPFSNNNANLPMAIPSAPVAQPTFETIPNFQHFNQTNPTHSNAFSDVVAPQQDSQAVDLVHRNQELGNLLQMEKVRNHELMVKVSQQHSHIEEISKELEQLRKNGNAIHELQQQMSAQIQTVNILVGEKSDLTAKLQQRDQRINEIESETVELRGRLNASRHRVSELEKDLTILTQSHQKYDGSQQALCTEIETIQEDNKRLRRLHQEACDENTEIQHQLAFKTKEIDELRNAIDSKCSELEMARVRLEQLTGGDLTHSNDTSKIATQNQCDQRLLDTERQIIELQNMISELTNDRDRTQQQYQTYVQHLTNETTMLNQRLQELAKANEKLTKREESLVNHVQELEKQIQKQISTQRRLAALRDEEKPKTDETNRESYTGGNGAQAPEELADLREKLSAIEKEKNDLNVSHNILHCGLQFTSILFVFSSKF